MYRLFCIIILVFFYLNASGQSDSISKEYFGISIGISNPVGKFGKTEKMTDGFAQAGSNLRVEWNAVKGNSNMGISGKFGYFRNEVMPFVVDEEFDYNYSVESAKSSKIHFMLGPSYSIPAKDIIVGINAQVGLLFFRDYDWNVIFDNHPDYDSYKVTYSLEGAFKFVYSFSSNVRFRLGKKTQGLVSVEYLSAKVPMKTYSIIDPAMSTTMVEKVMEYDSKINVINVNWGVAVAF